MKTQTIDLEAAIHRNVQIAERLRDAAARAAQGEKIIVVGIGIDAVPFHPSKELADAIRAESDAYEARVRKLEDAAEAVGDAAKIASAVDVLMRRLAGIAA